MKRQSRNGGILPHRDNSREYRTQGLGYGHGIRLGVRVFLLVILQATLIARLDFFGASPDILLAYVAVIAVTGRTADRGRIAAVSGIAAGFLADAVGGTLYGCSALLYFAVAFVGSLLVRRTEHGLFPSLLSFYAVFLPIAVCKAGFTLVAVLLSKPVGFSLLVCLKETLLPECFGTLLFALPMFFLYRGRD